MSCSYTAASISSKRGALLADISPVFYSATVLDPNTGAQVTKTFYTSTVPFGAQRYDKRSGAPRYSGMTFSMTER